MKKFLFLAISLFFIAALNLTAVAQRSTITKFEGEPLRGFIVTGAFDIRISAGSETKATVELPDEMTNKLTFELTDDKYVRIGYGAEFESLFVSSKNRPKATLVLSRLDYMNLSGATVLIGSGTFKSDKFVMTIAGSAFASFVLVDCDEAAISVAGSANIEDVKVTAKGHFALDVSGSAKVGINGSAQTAKVVTSGASLTDLLRFNCGSIDAITSGMSQLKVNVPGKANVVTSGMSRFRYTGEGVVVGDGAKRL